MLKVLSRSFFALAAVAALIAAPVAYAQTSDLSVVITESADPAGFGEMVDYLATYSNAGPDAPDNGYLNVDLPPGMPVDLQTYIDGDPNAVFLMEEVFLASVLASHEPAWGYGAECEGFVIQTNYIDQLAAGEYGEMVWTLPMPEVEPSTNTVSVMGPTLDFVPNFNIGTCDDCEDMAGTCFGPRLSQYAAVTAPIELVNDGGGVGTADDGCEPLVGFTPGNIALIDRGECYFDEKAANAMQAGASAVILGQNIEDDRLGGDGLLLPACTSFCGLISIPVIYISQNDNMAIQADLQAGEVMGTMGALQGPTMTTHAYVWEPAGAETDGNADNDDWWETTTVRAAGDPPVAAFSYSPEMPIDGDMITFTDASTGEPTSWMWDFGDGMGTSMDQNPTYTYTTFGTYTVSLIATNANGDSDPATMDVMVSEFIEPGDGTPVYFAAGAAAAGDGGSYWSTDAEINNRGDVAMSYTIELLKRGEDNTEPMSAGPFTLDAGMSARYTNVFGDLFAFEGAGAFAFVIDNVDDAVLTSRTFNSFDDGNLAGTFGQGIPATTEADMIPANTKVRLIQLSADDMFRTNIGFLNGTDANMRIMVEFFLADGTSLGEAFQDLAPYSNTQWNNAFSKVTDDAVADGYVDVWTEAGMFTVYGSVVGNDDFNDPTTVVPQ